MVKFLVNIHVQVCICIHGPQGPGNSGVFNFSVCKALLKARHCWVRFCGKIPAKSPGSTKADNNVEQQLGVVLMKKKI